MMIVLAVGGVCVLGLLIVIAGLIAGVGGEQLPILFLAAVTTVVGLSPIAINGILRRGHVMLSLLAMVYSAYYTLPALARYVPAAGPAVPGSMATQIVTPADVVAGQAIALTGLISLLAGYALPIGRQVSILFPRPRVEWPRTTGFALALGMLVLGWTLTLMGSVGLLPASLGTGFIGTLASARVWAVCLIAILAIQKPRFWPLAALAVLIAITMVYGFLTGSKREALVSAALPALAYMLIHRRISWKWIVAGTLALVMMYPLSEFYRTAVVGAGRTSAVDALLQPNATLGRVARFASETSMTELVTSGLESTAARIDGLGVTSVFVRETPRIVPHQNGRTLILVFIAPIPRAIWPTKPDLTIGQWITDTYSSGLDTRTAPTQVGEFYINFGFLGVIGGMLLLGSVLRFAHEILIVRGNTTPALLAATIVLYYLVTKFEAAVAKQYSNILFALGPLLVTHLAIRILDPRASTASYTDESTATVKSAA